MPQQASGPLAAGPDGICSSCAVGGSPLPLAWAAVLPLGGLLFPGLRGSPFPRPSFRQQPIVRSFWLERENLRLRTLSVLWVQVPRFC